MSVQGFQENHGIATLKRKAGKELIVEEGVHSREIKAFHPLQQAGTEAQKNRDQNHLDQGDDAGENRTQNIVDFLLTGDGRLNLLVEEPGGLQHGKEGK